MMRMATKLGSGWPVAVLAAAALLQSGCAGWSYRQVQIGQQLRDYEKVFPEGKSRWSTSSVCYLERDALGRTDAVVLLLTRDRQVCGKLHATHLRRDYGFKVDSGYALHGEIDPELARFQATGPIDMLRAIADDLTAVEVDDLTREAHGWIAAGLVRLVQRWPHIGDAGPAFPRLTEMLERVPGGGGARITVTRDNLHLLEYTQGVTP